jgi:hypothetical protein
MNWLGDVPEDYTTVVCMFTTHDGNGAPVAPLSAFEAADVKIYKNGVNTEKTTTNGVTMTSPFDSIVGLHCVVIDTSNDTGDSGFWTSGGGGTYTIVLNPDTETVNGQTALKVLGQFGIALSPALRPTTAGRTLDVSATGEAGIDWANVGSPTTALALTGTTIASSQKVDVDTIKTNPVANGGTVTFPTNATLASTTGAVGSVTGAVGSVTGLTASDVGSIKTKTDFLPSATAGAAGGVFIAGTNAATTITTALTTTFTGNLTGSVGSVSGAVGSVSGNIGGNVGGNVTGSVGSVTGLTASNLDATISSRLASASISLAAGAVTVGTNNDKTGYALTSGERTSIANEVEAQIIDDTDSEKVLTAITDKIASVNPDLSGLTLSAIASSVWSNGTRLLTAGTNIVLAKGTGVTGFNDLSAAQVNAEADIALADAGVTTTVTGRIDAAVSTRLASGSYTAPDNTSIAAIKAKTDSLAFTVSGEVGDTCEALVEVNFAAVIADDDAGIDTAPFRDWALKLLADENLSTIDAARLAAITALPEEFRADAQKASGSKGASGLYRRCANRIERALKGEETTSDPALHPAEPIADLPVTQPQTLTLEMARRRLALLG